MLLENFSLWNLQHHAPIAWPGLMLAIKHQVAESSITPFRSGQTNAKRTFEQDNRGKHSIFFLYEVLESLSRMEVEHMAAKPYKGKPYFSMYSKRIGRVYGHSILDMLRLT